MSNPKTHIKAPVPVRCIVTVYVFVATIFWFGLSLILQLLSWLLLAPLFLLNPRFKEVLLGGFFHFAGAASGFFFNPFWRLVIVRPPPEDYKPSDTLVIVNHLSGADPWICAAALFPWELKYIYKGDLTRVPVAGWSLTMSGDLPLHFTKEKGGWGTAPGAVQNMMARVKTLQGMGIGQVIFPEGTRSKSGRLQPFKDGFFKYAIENNSEILPCVIHNAQNLWPMGSTLLDMGSAYFAFGDPTRPKEGETAEQLKERVRASMITLLTLCPLYDAETEQPLNEMSASRGQGLKG